MLANQGKYDFQKLRGINELRQSEKTDKVSLVVGASARKNRPLQIVYSV